VALATAFAVALFGAGFVVDAAGAGACGGFALVADGGVPASPAARAEGARTRLMAVPKHKGAHFLSMAISSHA
jgi:hypothetical protein